MLHPGRRVTNRGLNCAEGSSTNRSSFSSDTVSVDVCVCVCVHRCGSGLSGEALTEAGHFWVGVDISQHMLGG